MAPEPGREAQTTAPTRMAEAKAWILMNLDPRYVQIVEKFSTLTKEELVKECGKRKLEIAGANLIRRRGRPSILSTLAFNNDREQIAKLIVPIFPSGS